MSARGSIIRQPDYGLDAPPVVYVFLVVAVFGAVALGLGVHFSSLLIDAVGVLVLLVGVAFAAAMAYSSRRGKILLRDRIFDEIQFRGDEDILDLGCGRGLMLLGAVVRATRGSGTGIDLWRNQDQGGSSRENCLENARRLGVSERVRLVDGDMSDLPFADGSYDLITASLAIHNISDRERRAATFREIFRVLRPGGRFVVVDFAKTAEYAEDAQRAGLVEVRRSGVQVLMFPLVRVVQGVRPAA
ncbi:class I SAM-dependent methyltransferase [Crossiella cryophila]|uniref:SAM-dependent methyltransferase n=1 Tax=Crossiella cryophila TaxID=43355 RepID=A0A7W7FXA7_9PSEU|nr:class I SAM-dependent methyltransferase [Crossiella cryophila]MBB4680438.1 SAM-dependent methyltransferase [Crossiella cryophila]